MSPSPPTPHSHSHTSSKFHPSSPASSRPTIHTAATVIPTLHPTASNSPCSRDRARTSAAPSSSSPDIRRRSGTTGQRPPPLDLDRALPSLRSKKSPQRLGSLAEVPQDRPSAPIPIPSRPKERSPPTTPLTARARSPVNFFGFQQTEPSRPHISASLTPYYTTGTRRISSSQSDPVVQRGFPTMGPRPGSPLHQYTPTSPLSPKLTAQLPSSAARQKDRHPPKSMNIAGLPKFHPANFPSSDASPALSSSRNPRPIPSQSRPTRGSDAQQQLQQYQRGQIASHASAAQSSFSMYSDGFGSKPSPPRLTPLRSPVDPMTPLELGGGSDYLLAGSSSLTPGSNKGDARELVERLVRRENERRNHPEARSGSVSPGLSPGLSPELSPA